MSYILDALRRAESDRERQRGQVPGLYDQALTLDGDDARPHRGRRVAVWGGAAIVVAAAAAIGIVWRERAQTAATQIAAAPAPTAVVQAPTAVPMPTPSSSAPEPRVLTSVAAGDAVVRAAAPTTAGVPPTPALPAAAVVQIAPAAPIATPPHRAPALPRTSPARQHDAAGSRVERAPHAESAIPRPLPASAASAEAVSAAVAAAAMPASAATPRAGRAPTSTEPRALTLAELSAAQRAALPPMTIGGAIYSEAAASRFVLVNGQVVREGEAAAPGVTLERIGPKIVTLRWRELRIEIPY